MTTKGRGEALSSDRPDGATARRARRARALAVGGVLAVLAALLVSEPALAADPQLSTTASASGFPVGSPIFDFATLGGGDNPTGTISFVLYGPDDLTCAGGSIFTSVIAVTGNGNYQSDTFTPHEAGTYQWVASYSGDANNTAVASPCGDVGEQVQVAKRVPIFSTQASLLSVAGEITDVATIFGEGPAGPTGTITFELFGPNNLTCVPPATFTSTVAVNGNGDYESDPFTPLVGGTYQWRANYSGDDNNFGVGSICTDPAESVVVVPGLITPTLTTTASPSVEVGQPITDTATLSGGVLPTGTITFTLYGPDDATCSGAAASTSTKPVNGNGSYTSDPFTPTRPARIGWVASYGGDVGHNAVVGACNDPSESVVVTGRRASP